MQLQKFRVTNFRSVRDSGEIDVAQITSILGRNESGKTTLLRALESLNPASGFKALDPVKNFPRDRRLEECTDDTPVVSTSWSLDPKDVAELKAILPRLASATGVNIGRRYGGKTRSVGFVGESPIAYDGTEVRSKLKKIHAAVGALADRLEEAPKAALEAANTSFEKLQEETTAAKAWAPAATTAFGAIRKALAAADAELTDKQEQSFDELEDLAITIAGDDKAHTAARTWAIENIPTFILFDEYPSLPGHQDIAAYLTRKSQAGMNDGDRDFEKLCKVAGINPAELQELSGQSQHEKRNQLANRAGSVVTTEIRRLWKDRSLKVRFNLDGQHFDTFVSDPNETYDVEVNLEERSRGFQWFFSFYITFWADTNGGSAANAVLLLDEPGLYLHAKSQTDLLRHFRDDFTNQILYTTHSPFMVPTDDLSSVRTVSIDETAGTTVSNDPTGDARTLFPLQAALGYNLAQSLFVGPNNLVVEGVTDYWILSCISAYMFEQGRPGLREDLTITPAGGAQKVSYMVALLSSESLNVLLLMDFEKAALTAKDELVKSKLIAEDNVVFVVDGFDGTKPKEADIEDLLDSAVYETLVRESYSKELKGVTLNLNAQIPRIAKRFESAFADAGIPFYKTRPARLLMQRLGKNPKSVVTEDSLKRFETLFGIVNTKLQKHVEGGKGPLGVPRKR